MKVAIVGSRKIIVNNIEKYVPKNATLLLLGGTKGVDSLAEKYADTNGIPKLIYNPDYEKHGKSAPLIRNKLMVDDADFIIAIWNGISIDTKRTIDYTKSVGKKVRLILIDVTGIEIFPGNLGMDCLGNGEHFDENAKRIECCCDECGFLLCCVEKQSSTCRDCQTEYCPRKYQNTL